MSKVFTSEYKGSFLPAEPWEGTVQSVYSKAVNLLHPSGILISVVDGPRNMTDYGLTVEDFNAFLPEISRGSRFLWKNNQIIFHDFVIDISKAFFWSGSVDRFPAYIHECIKPFKNVFIESAETDGLSPVVTGRAGNLYAAAALRILSVYDRISWNKEAAPLDVSPLVGLGIGFTPSGDDFISGALLFEVLTGRRGINRERIKENLEKTTVGGKTLLSLALKDSFPSYLKEFALSLHAEAGNPADIVKKALQHGSTSGSDALSGFFWIAELF